jgi:hypothetical protein
MLFNMGSAKGLSMRGCVATLCSNKLPEHYA